MRVFTMDIVRDQKVVAVTIFQCHPECQPYAVALWVRPSLEADHIPLEDEERWRAQEILKLKGTNQ